MKFHAILLGLFFVFLFQAEVYPAERKKLERNTTLLGELESEGFFALPKS